MCTPSYCIWHRERQLRAHRCRIAALHIHRSPDATGRLLDIVQSQPRYTRWPALGENRMRMEETFFPSDKSITAAVSFSVMSAEDLRPPVLSTQKTCSGNICSLTPWITRRRTRTGIIRSEAIEYHIQFSRQATRACSCARSPTPVPTLVLAPTVPSQGKSRPDVILSTHITHVSPSHVQDGRL